MSLMAPLFILKTIMMASPYVGARSSMQGVGEPRNWRPIKPVAGSTAQLAGASLRLLKLRFSAAPKGPKQENPGGGNPACGVGPGDPIRMRIRAALKGRNKILDHKPVLPLQGVAILNTRSNSQGGALGWHVAAPSGRDSRNATSKCAIRASCLSR